MPHTSDNDKKAKDNNALRHEKNMMREKNRKAGKNQYSRRQTICKKIRILFLSSSDSMEKM